MAQRRRDESLRDLTVYSKRQARGTLAFSPKVSWDWRLRIGPASAYHILDPDGTPAKVEAIWADGEHRSTTRCLLFVTFPPCGLQKGMSTQLIADNNPASRVWIDARRGIVIPRK
jgi:hypothetical protein